MNYHDPLANVPYQALVINGYRVSAQLITVPIHGKLFRLSADSFRQHGEALDARDGWNRVKDKESGTRYEIADAPTSGYTGPAPAADNRVGIRFEGDNVLISVPRSVINR